MSTVVDETIDRAVVAMALATFLAALALALPWWTATTEVTAGGSGVSAEADAGPFYAEDGVVETWQVVVPGLLAAFAFLGFVVGLTSLTGHIELHPAWEAGVPKLVYGSAVLLAAGLVLAVAVWPAGGASEFWTDAPISGDDVTVGPSASAGLGFYAGVLAVVLGPVAVRDARNRAQLSGSEGDPSPGPGRTRA